VRKLAKIIWAVAALIGMVVVVSIAAGGGSSPDASKTATVASHAPPAHHHHRHHHRYGFGGLGGTQAAFVHHNQTHAPPNLAGAPPGLAWYHIDRVAHGRVVELDVTENADPPMGDADRLALVEGIMLPGSPVAPIHQTRRSEAVCDLFRDPALKRLTGYEYAEASTITGSTQATLEAVATPTC
jgi:hypothetical protein